jgi:hypothetical protein
VFYWSGPLFPFALPLIGTGLARTRNDPLWTSILVCAIGVAFPLSGVPMIEWLGPIVDLAIVVAFGYLRMRGPTCSGDDNLIGRQSRSCERCLPGVDALYAK